MSEQTWTIVQFEEDNSVEAVPSTWIQGQTCFWPTYSRDKLMTAIRKHESLNTCWPSYQIRSFRNSTFNDYSKARSKARTAEVTSDLTSEVEENAKRKRIRKTISSCSSEESVGTSSLPLPPKIKKKMNANKENTQPYSRSTDNLPATQFTSLDTANKNTIPSTNNASLDRETTSVSTPCNSTCSCCYTKLNEKIANTLVTQNYLIRSVVTEVLSEIKEIKLQLKNISQNTNTNENETIVTIFSRNELHFPLRTGEDLQTVELILEDNNEMNNAINELKQIGGNNIYDFIRRALSMILTNEIANKYSFFGRKKKKTFCNLNICKLLINASQKGGFCDTSKEAEQCIQGWLRRAAERGKIK